VTTPRHDAAGPPPRALTLTVNGQPHPVAVEAVYSCLVLAVECEAQEIETVEGLARGQELTAVQEAFVACDALECGFCTPGQILSMEAALRRQPEADEATLTEAVTGNLCRCGAYRNIGAAAGRVAATSSGGPG
jgi:aerobic-type carbon monoxide dehydrogenase small subunit (CoxS/CutS family)